MTPLHADVRTTLAGWTPPDPGQAALRDEVVAFLDGHADATSRACRTAHVTASTLVVTPGVRRVLLVEHPVVGRWLQLGGHLESTDATLRDAAAREAAEECGVDDVVVDPVPLRLDRHTVRCRLGDRVDVLHHLDVQHVAVVGDDVEVRAEDGARLAWFAPDALPPDADDAVRALVAAARERVG